MSPRHVYKQMISPYFQTEHYKNESIEFKVQAKIEKIFNKFKFWNKNKESDAE